MLFFFGGCLPHAPWGPCLLSVVPAYPLCLPHVVPPLPNCAPLDRRVLDHLTEMGLKPQDGSEPLSLLEVRKQPRMPDVRHWNPHYVN